MNKRGQSQPAIKPVRPFKRFMDTTKCDTGINPIKNFEHFIGRDPTQHMHRSRKTITLKEDFAEVPRGKVPFGTTKCTFNLGLDNEGKLDRNSIGYKTCTFPRSPTDHISSQPPAQERPFQNLFDRMVQKSKYAKNTKTTNLWAPKPAKISTANNLNSTSYNLISHDENKWAAQMSYT